MRKTQNKNPLWKLLLLIWSQTIIIIFLISPGRLSFLHFSKMFEWQSFFSNLSKINLGETPINLSISLFGILLFAFSSAGLGASLLHLLRFSSNNQISSPHDLLAFLSTAFLLGQGFYSVTFLILGGFYKFSFQLVFIVLSAGIFLGFRFLRLNTNLSIGIHLRSSFKKFNRYEKGILLLSICVLTISILYTNSRLSYDAVSLYFVDAKMSALLGRIQYSRFEPFFISHFQTGILFSALIQVFGDQTARMLSWLSGVIIIIFAMLLGERAGVSRKGRLILLVFLLTTTAFVDLFGDGKVDLASSTFAIATIYWLVVGYQNPSTSIFIVIGLLAGFAMIARPNNIPLLGGYIGLFYLWQANFKKLDKVHIKKLFKQLIWISVGLLILLGYYLFVNWLHLGSPLAPIRATQTVSPDKWQWAAFQREYLWLIKLTYPIVITFVNIPQTLGNISPLFIAFLPALLINDFRNKRSLSRTTISLSVITATILFAWIALFFTVFEIRYVLFLWIIMYFPVAEICANIIDGTNPLLRKATQFSLVFILLFIAVRIIYVSIETYSPIDENGYPQCTKLNLCELQNTINEMASPGDRVLTLNTYRYYLRPYLLTCSTQPEEYEILTDLSYQDTIAFWEKVYELGYKYIIYDNTYSERHLKFGLVPKPENTPDWMILEQLNPISNHPDFIYKIQVVDPPIAVQKTCIENDNGAWEVNSLATEHQ